MTPEPKRGLYACLYAREFPAQAMLRLRPEMRSQPVAILQGDPPRQEVCSRNTRAAALGVEAGLTRAELEVFPTVARLPRSLTEEASARAALLQAAGQFSPRVEDRSLTEKADTYFCCILDIAGAEKLFGPPEMLGQQLIHNVRALSIQTSLVVSANLHAALCLARRLPIRIAVIPPGEEAKLLAPLPLPVLNLTSEHAETFARWGISSLGALAALPEKELIARLGQEGRRLRQLARGDAPHLLVPTDAPFTLEERMELDAPVELLDSLLFVLGVLLDQLITRATAQILALASVTVTLRLEGGSTHTRTVRPALPNNDRRLWLRLLHLDLQAHQPSAATLSVTLAAEPGSTSKVQQGLFSPQLPEPNRLDITLARIRSLVGDARVGSAVLEDTHRPDSFRMTPFAIPSTATAVTTPEPQMQACTARRRLRPPEPITVTLQQRQPASFYFRNKRYTVERAWGPWFFSGNWWGIECWSMEKWDLVARAPGNSILSCAIARHPMREEWRIEELYD
jgi:protein ImuB